MFLYFLNFTNKLNPKEKMQVNLYDKVNNASDYGMQSEEHKLFVV